MQDKTGPACGKVPFVQLFYPPRHISDGERNEKGVRDVAPGAIVKQIRSSTGLSQRSFAESIGICQSAVGYYESGKHRVSDGIWEKIKSVYHDVIVQLAIPEEMPNEAKKELPPQSEELRRIRLASGLSQREFAESIGVSKSGSTPNLMVHHGNLGGDDLSGAVALKKHTKQQKKRRSSSRTTPLFAV